LNLGMFSNLKVSGDVLIDIDNFYGNQHFITFEPLAQTWHVKMW
jgi:hypothetical protein